MPLFPHQAYRTYGEIVEHPQGWQSAIASLSAQGDALRTLWKQQVVTQIVFTGCGSTYYLARAAAPICRQTLKAPAIAHPASDLWLYPDETLPTGGATLLVALSRSGETSETLRAIEQFKKRGCGPVVCITCYAETPMVELADISVIAHDAHEESVAQTRSFSSMAVAVSGLAAQLADQALSAEFLDLPALGRQLLEDNHALARQLGKDKSLDRFFFLGGGSFYGYACEAMLKMKEMTLSYSEAFHFMEFRHGPMSMVTPSSLVVGLLSERAFSQELTVLKDMRRLGARALGIVPGGMSAGELDYVISLPGGLTDAERGPLYMPALQMLAFYRSLANGQNPDKPHNLTKVVNLGA
jgi:glutamine---fructose-6-phosphate transaminase (isomerizing)